MFVFLVPFLTLIGFFGLLFVVEILFDIDIFFGSSKVLVILGIVAVLVGIRIGAYIDKSVTDTTLNNLNGTYYEVSVYSGGEEVYHTGTAVGLSTSYGRASFFDVETGQTVSAYGTVVMKQFTTEEGKEDDELRN